MYINLLNILLRMFLALTYVHEFVQAPYDRVYIAAYNVHDYNNLFRSFSDILEGLQENRSFKAGRRFFFLSQCKLVISILSRRPRFERIMSSVITRHITRILRASGVETDENDTWNSRKHLSCFRFTDVKVEQRYQCIQQRERSRSNRVWLTRVLLDSTNQIR